MEERLQIVITELLMSIPEFAREIGVSDDLIYKTLKGKAVITPYLKKKIYDTFPQLNKEWFEEGKGQMYKWKLEEKAEKYEISWQKCKQKDNEIAKLRAELNETQKDYIDLLKEVSTLRKHASG